MPLLKKKVLEKIPMPELLRDDEEVFHCEMTNEIFRDYDEFAERTILCNSMVWTCSMTGKSNLTYSEALQSEENARKTLNDFPVELKIPVLFIASKTRRRGFTDMVDDVHNYIRDRYFIGENIEACFTNDNWKDYHVLQVMAPSNDEIKKSQTNGANNSKEFYPPASLYKYDVELLDEDKDVSEKMLIHSNQIRRKKGLFSKDKIKLFMKQYVEISSDGVWLIKASALNDFNINKTKFEQIFDGPLPNFEASVKKVKQETLIKYFSKSNGNQASQQNGGSKKVQKNAEQKQENREKPVAIDISKEIKEWYKPKEDLDLEDQKKMPAFVPVEIKIPLEYFGDVVMVIDFVQLFGYVLNIKDFFPSGLSLQLLENALLENELAGNFTNLLQMLLNGIFKLQEEEAHQYSSAAENNSDFDYENYQECDNLSLKDATKFATAAANYCKNYQGLTVTELPLYSLTVTEILRLHLLTSGAQINFGGTKWRYMHRGGYSSQDDPGLDICLNEPDILHMLATHNVVQLPMKHKFKIINCLVNQILTYADIRDIIEEKMVSSKHAKLQLRLAQNAEKKRLQEMRETKKKLQKDSVSKTKHIVDEMDRLNKENEAKISEHEKEVEKLTKDCANHQMVLGFDRAFRKYIKSEGIPGIFIECNPEFVGQCQTKLTEQIPSLVNGERAKVVKYLIKFKGKLNSSDKENHPENKHDGNVNGHHFDAENYHELLMCSMEPESCLVHSMKNNNQWFFIQNQTELEKLIDSLNRRGIREADLKQVLQENKETLATIIAKSPGHILNPKVEKSPSYQPIVKNVDGDNNFGYPSDSNPSQVEHEVLLDLILNLETKIHGGNLGALKTEREKWIETLTKHDYDAFEFSYKFESVAVNSTQTNGSRSSTPDIKQKDPGEYWNLFVNKEKSKSQELGEKTQKAVKCLALALVQVSQAVDSKFLNQPLGSGKRKKYKKEASRKTIPANLLEKWQQSLLQSSSFSQIFLHYATLDNCVNWSKSALCARCRICRLQKDPDKMLLCDKCNWGHHIYCLRPPLKEIPKGDWFCKKCDVEQNADREVEAPVKKRRKIFVDESEEESYSTDEVATNGHDKDNESDEMQLDICATCNSPGELLSCYKCAYAYHVDCVVPPLRRPPRGKWLCHKCKDKYDKGKYAFA